MVSNRFLAIRDEINKMPVRIAHREDPALDLHCFPGLLNIFHTSQNSKNFKEELHGVAGNNFQKYCISFSEDQF